MVPEDGPLSRNAETWVSKDEEAYADKENRIISYNELQTQNNEITV